MAQKINIDAGILLWAIDRAGFDSEEYLLNKPRVQKWINQESQPTVKQLEQFANRVHIPFGYLLLPQPVEEEVPIPFFRNGSNKENNKISLNVYDTIVTIQKRQEWLSNYLKDSGFDRLSFVGKFKQSDSYLEIVKNIREVLDLDPMWAKAHPSWEKALQYLTQAIEGVGIIVTFNGIVGNNTRRVLDVNECRGFVMVDNFAPFLFINAADAKAAQMFTIAHELAHIWVGASAGFDFQNMLPADDPLERLCDLVAAEFLVPESYLLEHWEENQNYVELGKTFKVSPIVIARRALDLNLIDKKSFFTFYNSYISDLEKIKANRGSGGDFYTTVKKRISLAFAAHVNQAVKTNNLLYRDAYRLTGLKGNTYDKFLDKHIYSS